MAEKPRQEHKDAPSNEGKLPRGLIIGFAIIAAILLVVILLMWVKPSDAKEKKDFIQAVGVLLAALAGLGGLYFTRVNTDKQLRQARESQEQTQRLSEQGQITERFTRAIDHLGATADKGQKKLEIRLGGIYALERIDKESPERAYHATVMEVLTAYVRENSRLDRGQTSTSTSAAALAALAAEQDKEGIAQEAVPTLLRPPADIQAILDVLNRREEDHVPEQHQVLLDLHEANLQGANLHGALLLEANLIDATLLGANLLIANLLRANLLRANLKEAYLQEAKLQGAELEGANLIDANLIDANLIDANLQGANLQGANLQRANLQRANLQGADLVGAINLAQAQIEDAFGDKDTKLPEDLQRPAEWSKGTDDQTHGDE
jgi:uncharacterized protein YjbI with pentapeptide repeats